MKFYINLRNSHKSHANAALRQIGKRLGAGEVRRDIPSPQDADFLIQWGFKPTVSLLTHIEADKPYAIVDLGYGPFRTERFSVSINGFHGTAWRDPKVFDREPRPSYGYSDWRSGEGSKVLVCGQMPNDQSLRGQDIDAWMGRAAIAAAEAFKKPVIKRPHPKMLNPWEEDKFIPLEKELEDCYCNVTWTSTAGIDSVLRGVPTVAMHPGSMAYSLAAQDMRLRTPSGRQSFVHELSWREWEWTTKDLDRLAEYIIDIAPAAAKAPVDSPRNIL